MSKLTADEVLQKAINETNNEFLIMPDFYIYGMFKDGRTDLAFGITGTVNELWEWIIDFKELLKYRNSFSRHLPNELYSLDIVVEEPIADNLETAKENEQEYYLEEPFKMSFTILVNELRGSEGDIFSNLIRHLEHVKNTINGIAKPTNINLNKE